MESQGRGSRASPLGPRDATHSASALSTTQSLHNRAGKTAKPLLEREVILKEGYFLDSCFQTKGGSSRTASKTAAFFIMILLNQHQSAKLISGMRGKVLQYKGQHLRRAVVPFQTYLGKLPADFRGKGINKAFNHKSQIIHLKISGMLACGLSALILTVSNLSWFEYFM